MAIIKKLDHYGRGIIYDNDKITFINDALVDEDIDYKISKETKKYNEGIVTKLNLKSKNRVVPKCPYYDVCGGCSLQHMTYDCTLDFKKNKVSEILNKYADLKPNINIIMNDDPFNYRNKLSLKVKNKEIGFYKNSSHNLVKINKCFIAKASINDVIDALYSLNITNGNITIRSNYNDEILVIIDSKDKISFDKNNFRNIKLLGLVVNNKLLYGEDKFIEIIDNNLFQVSYNSFFQVNSNVTKEIFKIVEDTIDSNDVVADLFCGVGTLSIISARKAKKVYGIEVVDNAIKNALINKKMNKLDNLEFLLGDANSLVSKINDKINTIIVDPPRSGLSSEGINAILDIKPNKLLYISCDPMTLARDLKLLSDSYEIKKFYIADMFSYTYHVESICALKLK